MTFLNPKSNNGRDTEIDYAKSYGCTDEEAKDFKRMNVLRSKVSDIIIQATKKLGYTDLELYRVMYEYTTLRRQMLFDDNIPKEKIEAIEKRAATAVTQGIQVSSLIDSTRIFDDVTVETPRRTEIVPIIPMICKDCKTEIGAIFFKEVQSAKDFQRMVKNNLCQVCFEVFQEMLRYSNDTHGNIKYASDKNIKK